MTASNSPTENPAELPAEPRRTSCDRLSLWLAEAPGTLDPAVRAELHERLMGRTSVLLFGGMCASLMAVLYAALQDRVTGCLLLAATVLSVAERLLTSRPSPGVPLNSRVCAVMSSGMVWTCIVGVAGLLCAHSGQTVLLVSSSCVVVGVTFGAVFNNAAAPRFCAVLVAMMLLPFLLASGWVHAPHMRWMLLQTPIWIAGTFFLIHRAHLGVRTLVYTQQRVAYLALNDQLTGLANRTQIMSVLNRCCSLENAEIKASSYILFLDLDGFKDINDTLGHAAGDELLCRVSSRLASAVRPVDVLGRLGGDEFVAILQGVTPTHVQEIADRMVARLAEPFDLAARTGVHIGVSIGGASLAHRSAGKALEKADKRLYAAKRAGKGIVRLGRAKHTPQQTFSVEEPCLNPS